VIHLDSNVAIALLNGSRHKVRAHFDAARDARAPMALSMIVFHELMYGAAYSAKRKENEDKIALFIAAGNLSLLPCTESDAAEAADIRAHLRKLGQPIRPFDVLIAGQARRAGATLVTANTHEFTRVPGLILVDWGQ
jgi:tRNA(fMet)-specific endonuclease VapC